MFLAFFLAAVSSWVPMRWASSEPKSLELLTGTPINCLLVERAQWSQPLIAAAKSSGIAVLGVLRPTDPPEAIDKARTLGFDGVVLEGDFEPAVTQRVRTVFGDSKVTVIELPSRAKMRLDSTSPIVGTFQGVWPGILAEENGSTKAAPSGAPWIHTNSGFLRFLRAATKSAVWLGYTPPANRIVKAEGYIQAICDAAMVGARWVVALDADFSSRLHSGDAAVQKDWNTIVEQLAWYESHPEWRSMQPAGQLAIVQDVNSGALFSGGVLDMIAVKHTPVRAVPSHALSETALKGPKMAVNVDPSGTTPEQKEVLKNFTRGGGTLLSGPADWKFPQIRADQITLGDNDVKFLDEIWKEVNGMTGRRNLGARLFNVSSMLSNLIVTSDSKQTVLQLVNYSGYPVENVTVHFLGKFKSARLTAPGMAQNKLLEIFETEDGSGVEVAKIAGAAAIVLD